MNALELHQEVWRRNTEGAADYSDLTVPEFNLDIAGFPPVPVDGVPEVVAAWRAPFSDFGRDRRILRSLADANGIAVEHQMLMTHTGDFTTPAGEVIPATGRKVTVRSVDVLSVRDGKLAQWRAYPDLVGLLQQLQ